MLHDSPSLNNCKPFDFEVRSPHMTTLLLSLLLILLAGCGGSGGDDVIQPPPKVLPEDRAITLLENSTESISLHSAGGNVWSTEWQQTSGDYDVEFIEIANNTQIRVSAGDIGEDYYEEIGVKSTASNNGGMDSVTSVIYVLGFGTVGEVEFIDTTMQGCWEDLKNELGLSESDSVASIETFGCDGSIRTFKGIENLKGLKRLLLVFSDKFPFFQDRSPADMRDLRELKKLQMLRLWGFNVENANDVGYFPELKAFDLRGNIDSFEFLMASDFFDEESVAQNKVYLDELALSEFDISRVSKRISIAGDQVGGLYLANSPVNFSNFSPGSEANSITILKSPYVNFQSSNLLIYLTARIEAENVEGIDQLPNIFVTSKTYIGSTRRSFHLVQTQADYEEVFNLNWIPFDDPAKPGAIYLDGFKVENLNLESTRNTGYISIKNSALDCNDLSSFEASYTGRLTTENIVCIE